MTKDVIEIVIHLRAIQSVHTTRLLSVSYYRGQAAVNITQTSRI